MRRGKATFSAPIRANLAKHAGRFAILLGLVLELATLTDQSPSAQLEFTFQDISITVNAAMTSVKMLSVKFSQTDVHAERIAASIQYKGWAFSANRMLNGKIDGDFSCSETWFLHSQRFAWCNVSMNNINECDAIELSLSMYIQRKPETIVDRTVSLTTQNFRMPS